MTAPVMLAGLNRANLPDSLKSRMIAVHMKRRLPGDETRRISEAVRRSRSKADTRGPGGMVWRGRGKIDLDALTLPDDIRDRDADIWEPPFAIAHVAGGEWPDT